MRYETVLQVDSGERCGELAQIGRGRSDEACELSETPMRGGDGCFGAGEDERQPFWIATARLNSDALTFDVASSTAFGPRTNRAGQFVQR